MKNAGWLEVSLVVDGEMAEAVAEVLARYVSGGVVIESTRVVADAEDEGHAAGPLRVCGYLPMNAEVEGKRQKIEEGLWYLGRIRPLPEAQFRPVHEENWAEAWKAHYRPVAIGRRLMIVPAWLEAPDPRRIPVRIDPGMAFGTGTHPTTQLCLELVDAILGEEQDAKNLGREAVIDLGCGSGILAIAALKLGAGQALGVDIDPLAIEAARQNAASNDVTGRLELGLGSVAEILAGNFSIQKAPLVLANILAPVLARMFGEGLGELLAPGGQMVLSGILEEQAGEVLAAAEAHGLRLLDRRQAGDWVALIVGTFNV